MICKECKYHSYVNGVHFCDSRNHKRRTVRISEEDAEKDIDCYWADSEEWVNFAEDLIPIIDETESEE